MEEVRSNSGQALGTAALITGLVTLVLSVIPCLGIIAIIPGIVTVILAAIALSQAAKDNAPRGIIVAGLIIGIVALMISSSQLAIGTKFSRHADRFLPSEIRQAIKDATEGVTKDVLKNLEDARINIKIENDDEKIEINASGSGRSEELVKQLEELEKGKEEKKDTLSQK
ncbi:MAG: hypothetical protein ACUVTX_01030 [Bacteroidales bacterium]